MKRLFDFIISLLGIILLLPVFIIIAILIKTTDSGPIIFKQKRVGKDGRLFVLFKFRSMRVLHSLNEEYFQPGNLSRITSIGGVIRRTKLDELPQLFNVLLGEMSLVGPRPEVEKWVAVYPERWKKILTIRPGVTDNASIVFRNEELLLAASDDPEKTYQYEVLPKKLDLYDEYIAKMTFCGDLKIIFKTIFIVIVN